MSINFCVQVCTAHNASYEAPLIGVQVSLNVHKTLSVLCWTFRLSLEQMWLHLPINRFSHINFNRGKCWLHFFAHFEKRSERFRPFSSFSSKILTVFGLKTFGMLTTFNLNLFQTVFPLWPESSLIAEGQQELRVKVFFRLWKLKIDVFLSGHKSSDCFIFRPFSDRA